MDNICIQNYIDKFLQSKSLSNMSAAAAAMPKFAVSSQELQVWLNVLVEHIHKNDHRKAVATLLSMMLTNADWTISQLRRNSHLRASKYKFQSGCLVKVVTAALYLGPIVSVEGERTEYLQSVLSLYGLAPKMRQLRISLVQRLALRKKVALKTLLAIINYFFAVKRQGNWEGDADSLGYWSNEQLASAFSYLFILYKEEIGDLKPITLHVDEHAVKELENIYASLFIDAAKLGEFREAEALVDCLPYKATFIGSTTTVSSIDTAMEKSIRLGYVQADMQVLIRNSLALKIQQSMTGARPSIEKFIEDAFSAGMGELVQVQNNPIERLVFAMPDDDRFFEPFSTDALFEEEVAMLYGAGIDLFQPEAGGSIILSDDLVALDVVKAQRLFSMMSAVFSQKLKSVENENSRNTLMLRSTIPVMKHEHLVAILEKVLPREKVEPVISLLTMTADESYVDIQYRPLIKIASSYVIPPAIVAMSNVVRNAVVANQLRKSAQFVDDPMQNAVENALKDAGFLVQQNVFLASNHKLETDILCWRDSELFIFECKNSYHPCSAHELRSSFAHLKKASSQLELRKEYLKDTKNQEKLFATLGWDVQPTANINTAIVTANRMFSGYSLEGNPVRHAHELINVLVRGTIERGNLPSLRFWREDYFQSEDLIDYLLGKSIVEAQMGLLRSVNRCFTFGAYKLEFETYVMDLTDNMETLDSRFTRVETDEE